MKSMITAVAVLIMMILPGSGYPAAQQQMGGQMQMGGQGGEPAQPPSQQPMMGMMCPMMSGMSGMSGGMGMMRMMGGGQMDSKTMAKMLQFRGEMLKAMEQAK